MSKKLRPLFVGGAFTICAIAEGDKCRVVLDLKELRLKKPESFRKVAGVLYDVSQNGFHGLHVNKLRFLGDDCFEVKEAGGLTRLFAFKDPSREVIIVVKNVWEKGNKKEQNQQINELKRFKKNFNSDEYELEVP